MKQSSALFPAAMALVFAAAGPVGAETSSSEAKTTAQVRAEIPFANNGGVFSWRAEDSDTVYFEDAHHNWYRATLFGTSPELPYAEAIGIDTAPGGTLDKFGAVIVKGQRYPFASFEKVDGPPKKRPGKG